ncbi:MAG: CHAT domain-containing protein [Nostocaceae cyanobacterium]|nr:CHAT domain-containing protein [Nostocaceae cyanobacterium]
MSDENLYNSLIQRISEFCKQSLKLLSNILIPFQIYFARFLNYLGRLYSDQGRYSKAEPLLQKSLELRKQLLGEVHPHVADSLNNLAGLYYFQGKYSKAEPLFQQSLELIKQLFGEVHPHVASSLNNLAMLYESQRRYTEAEPLFKKSLELIKQVLGEFHPDVATSLNNLAMLYQSQGRYSEAEPLFQQSLEIYQQLFGEIHPDIATSLNNLAMLYQSQARYSEAEALYEKSLELRKQIFGDVHPHVAHSLNNLATLYKSQGIYDEAEAKYQQSLELRKQIFGEFHPDVATTLSNLTSLYFDLGRYSEAEPLLEQSLELRKQVFGEVHPDVADSLNNLASLYFDLGRYSEAEPLLEQSLELRKQVFGEVHPRVADSLNNLALLYYNQRRYAEAEPLLEQSLELRKQIFGKIHPHIAISLNNLAILYTNTNRPQLALEKFQEAIEIEHRLMSQEFVGSSEDDRMRFLDKIRTTQYDLLSLIYKYYYPLEESEEKSKAIHTALDVVLKRKALSNAASAAINAAIYRNRNSEEIQEDIQNAFETLRSKHTQINNLRTSLYLPENLPRLEANQNLLKELNEEVQELEKYITRKVPEIRLEKELVNREKIASGLPENSSLIEFVYFPVYDFENNQWGNPRYLAFILPGQEPDKVQMFDLGEAEEIDQLIQEMHKVIKKDGENLDLDWGFQKSETSEIDLLLMELTNSIFQPLQNHLQAEELFICADGGITLIPFGILPLDTESSQLIIDKYNITYLNAARDLLRSKYQVQRHPGESLVFANPNFDLSVQNAATPPQNHKFQEEDRKAKNLSINLDSIANEIRENPELNTLGQEDKKTWKPFPPVPMTAKIAEVVAEKFKTKPFLEDRSLKRNLTNAKCPEKLVIATHGFFLSQKFKNPSINRDFEKNSRFHQIETIENPLFRSGFALAGANTWLLGGEIPIEAEEGIVFAQDVAGLDFWTNKIIILIICSTAVGDVIPGEGVKGLRSAFTAAGARLIIMSMWNVDANVSILLMNRFFANMDVRKLPTQLALKEAQNYIRTITKEDLKSSPIGQDILNSLQTNTDECPLQHPFFWGAWVCLGKDFPKPVGV